MTLYRSQHLPLTLTQSLTHSHSSYTVHSQTMLLARCHAPPPTVELYCQYSQMPPLCSGGQKSSKLSLPCGPEKYGNIFQFLHSTARGRGRKDRGGRREKSTLHTVWRKVPPTDFAGFVKRASSYLISVEKRISVDYSPVGGPLPIWIVEGKSIHHILVAFQGQQFLPTLPSPHLACPIIAPSYETEEERWTLSCKRNGVHDTYDEPDLLMAILVSGRMCVLSTLNSWNCLPWGSPSLPWSSAEREEGGRWRGGGL